jgi:uncharacterized small protein (DUF1192 family)
MDIYKVIYEKEEDGDLYGISIVDNPANEKMFVALSEQIHINLKSVDTVKKICTGIVLMPEQQIYREFEDGTPFLLTFDAPTIERLAQNFFYKDYQKNTRYNHDAGEWINGNCIIESWIVEDPKNDKLNALGFSTFPKGTWAVSMKLSDQAWSDYIETGKAKGFSIDSFVKMEKINLNKMKKASFLSKLVNLFKEGNVSLMDIDSSVGMLTSDSLELGSVVYDGQLLPLINAKFDFEGNQYSTDDNGAIKEIVAIEAENEVEVELPVEDLQLESTDVETELPVDVEETVEEDIEASHTEDTIEEKIKLLQSEIDKLNADKIELKKDNEKMSNELLNLQAKEISVKLGARPSSNNPINLQESRKSIESTLEVISRISNKNK